MRFLIFLLIFVNQVDGQSLVQVDSSWAMRFDLSKSALRGDDSSLFLGDGFSLMVSRVLDKDMADDMVWMLSAGIGFQRQWDHENQHWLRANTITSEVMFGDACDWYAGFSASWHWQSRRLGFCMKGYGYPFDAFRFFGEYMTIGFFFEYGALSNGLGIPSGYAKAGVSTKWMLGSKTKMQ